MKTEIPPKGVTARWVSRRITRSPESRAVISCGTGLSEVFASTPLYRRHLRSEYSSASEFRLKPAYRFDLRRTIGAGVCGPRPPPTALDGSEPSGGGPIRSEEHTSELQSL